MAIKRPVNIRTHPAGRWGKGRTFWVQEDSGRYISGALNQEDAEAVALCINAYPELVERVSALQETIAEQAARIERLQRLHEVVDEKTLAAAELMERAEEAEQQLRVLISEREKRGE